MIKTKLIYQIVAGLIAGSCFFASKKIGSPQHRIFVKPLTIQVDRNSPPYSAYEDSQIPPFKGSQLDSSVKVEKLVAGIKHIRKAGPKTFPEVKRKFKPLAIKLASAVTPTLSPREQIAYEYIKKNPAPKTMRQVAEELVSAAILEKEVVEQTGKPTKVLASNAGGDIVVQKVKKQTPNKKKPSTQKLAQNNTKKDNPSPEHSIDISKSTPRLFVLSGSISLHDGAAFIPGYDDIYIYHRINYEARSIGSVNIREASYKIDVEQAKGFIVVA